MIFINITKRISAILIPLFCFYTISTLEANPEEGLAQYNWQQTMSIKNGISMTSIIKLAKALQEMAKDIDGVQVSWIEYRSPDESNCRMYEAILHCDLKTKADINKLLGAQIQYLNKNPPQREPKNSENSSDAKQKEN